VGANTRWGRWAWWVGFAGSLAIAVGLLTPRAQGAGAIDTAAAHDQIALHATVVAPPAPAPSPAPRFDVHLIVAPIDGGDLAVYDAPGALAPSRVLPAVNELGNPLILLAVHTQGDWYEVLLDTRPNGSSAWVPASAVTAAVAQYEVEVSLSALSLQVIRIADGAVMMSGPIGIGAPQSPTPTGQFFVREQFPTSGANHPYGPMAFGLSGHSDVYSHFGTGDGRIAIHGTNQPSSIGAAASNGCVHVPNDVVVAMIPFMAPGTPVTISA
jgi:lipoprotein-anchoring transpeptidase ErfK/SrfK